MLKNIQSVRKLKTILAEAAADNGRLDTDYVYQTIEPLLAKVSISFEVFNILHTMPTTEDSIYAHSLNVALISSMLGRWLKLSDRDLETLAVSALLHDIGKLKIPAQVLDKPEKYEPKVVNALIRGINILYPGVCIELTNHEKGLVIHANEDNIFEPLVLNFRDNNLYDLSWESVKKEMQILDVMKTMDNRIKLDRSLLDEYQ